VSSGQEAVFAHVSDVVGGVQLKQGDKVRYSVTPGRDGRLKAINIRLL
jgi:cold shock CspA family protein